MRIKITEITEWRKDSALVGGDASREGWDAVQSLVLAEREAKADGGSWSRIAADGMLPFEYEAEADGETEAVEEALEAFGAKHCEFDYLKPAKCEYEVLP